MSEGKYEKAAVKNGGKGKKSVAVMAAVALILALAVGGTVAYIATKVDPINNQFLPAKVSCEVVTKTDANGDVEEISVKNTGNIPAYIRAAIVVNWMDGEGNVYGIAPKADEYTLTIKAENTDNWQQVGDFYYYKAIVPVGGTTSPLIDGITVKEGAAPSAEYQLSVEVVAEAIQAEGRNNTQTAVKAAWGVELTDGSWK